MKPFIDNILKFAAFALIFYVLLIGAWSFLIPFNFLKKNAKYPIGSKGFTYTRLLELDTVENIDLLFLGSSHTLRGFDTRIFQDAGVSSFNLGSPSQTPIQTKLLLDKYLNQLNPKLVVFEVYPATFDNDGVESSLDIIANSKLSIENLYMAMRVNHLKTYNTLIYHTFREIFGLNNNFKRMPQNPNDRYIKGGFITTSISQNESPITEEIKQNWKNRWDLNPDQIDQFQKVILLLKKNHIPFLLLQMPVTKEAYYLYENNNEVDSLFIRAGPYLNLNNEPVLDDHFDFMDYHHLNQRGVNKINLILIEKWKMEYPILFEQ